MQRPVADVATVRQEFTFEYFHDSRNWRIWFLKYLAELMSGQLRALVPDQPIYWAASKTQYRTISIEAFTSTDPERAKAIAQRVRKNRKRWHGYRTDIDWLEATRGDG